MIAALLFFLGVALLLYVVFAGADFGAGVLEFFLRREEEREIVSSAIAPVWEANHVWIVLVVVILFMGFPEIYTTLSVSLHLPLVALLVGIALRGSAFTFRHYDTDRQYHRLYTGIFAVSSVWCSFFLGVLGAAAFLGRVDPSASDFVSAYLSPWANGFCYAVGVFTVCLFAFLASVYLVGEGEPEAFRRKAKGASLAMIVSGGLVFLAAEASGLAFFAAFFTNPTSLLCFFTAGASWAPLFYLLARRPALARAVAAFQAALVLLGWFALQYPFALRFPEGGIRFEDAAAPLPTQRALLFALVSGSVVIFPALGYLLRVFKGRPRWTSS